MKDERIVVDSKDTIGANMFIKAHLLPASTIECPVCHSHDIVKNGIVLKAIKEKLFIDYSTNLILEIQRYKCKYCNHCFRDKTTIIEDNKNITLHMRLAILNDLREDLSLSNIAKKYNISVQSIYNIFESFVNINRHELPEVLCIDEFKNLRSADGKYACVLYDPMNHIIIDIIENRRLECLNEYFFHININELKNVKYFISDMYEPFRSIKKKFFPAATHIVDHFHFARYVYDAMDTVRIRVMKSFNTNMPQYRILKVYWHLFMKKSEELKEYEHYNHIRKKKTNTSTIIADSLAVSNEFDLAYGLKELFIYEDKNIHYENRVESLSKVIKSFRESEIDEFIEIANMFDNWFVEIGNSYIRFGDKRLNNAYLEGMNNRIKSIKKLSYGCDSFYYFRNRLMFIINKNEPIGRVDTSKIPRKPKRK